MKKTSFILAIFLCLSMFSCDKDDDVYTVGNDKGPSVSSIIAFKEVQAANLEADGITRAIIKIQIHPEAAANMRDIIFKNDLGAYANGMSIDTVTADAGGIASIILTSTKAGIAHIYAQVDTYTIDTTVEFKPALPDDILLSLDKYQMDTLQSVEVTASLFRAPLKGEVSDPIKVTFVVTPDLPQPESLIYPTFSFSADKKAVITISNPFFLQGRFKIEAQAINLAGDTLRRAAFFRIE